MLLGVAQSIPWVPREEVVASTTKDQVSNGHRMRCEKHELLKQHRPPLRQRLHVIGMAEELEHAR